MSKRTKWFLFSPPLPNSATAQFLNTLWHLTFPLKYFKINPLLGVFHDCSSGRIGFRFINVKFFTKLLVTFYTFWFLVSLHGILVGFGVHLLVLCHTKFASL